MNDSSRESGQTWVLTRHDVDALFVMWAGWYCLYHHQWFNSPALVTALTIEVTGDDIALNTLADLASLPGCKVVRERGKVIIRGAVEPLAHWSAEGGRTQNTFLLSILGRVQALAHERLLLSLALGPLTLHPGERKLDPARVYILTLTARPELRRSRIATLYQQGPGMFRQMRDVLSALRIGLQALQDVRSQVGTMPGMGNRNRKTEARRSYHFLCRDHDEAQAFEELMQEAQLRCGVASAGHILLTDMDTDLNFPLCMAYVRAGRKAGLFGEETLR